MSQNNFLIYKFTSPSGKSYIGQTKDLKNRISCHKASTGCPAFNSAIKKHGFENFKQEILKENLTLDEANHWEEFLISEHKTLSPNGYNLATGGKNSTPSDETKVKMSKAAIGRVFSPETLAKMAKSATNPSQETRAKIAAANLGKKHTAETRAKMSASQKNRQPVSDEVRKKISASKIGKKRPPELIEKMRILKTGVKLSEETKAKMSASAKGKKKSPEHIAKYQESQRLNRLAKKQDKK